MQQSKTFQLYSTAQVKGHGNAMHVADLGGRCLAGRLLGSFLFGRLLAVGFRLRLGLAALRGRQLLCELGVVRLRRQ